MIEPLGIARGDVAGDAFIKAEAREEAKSSGEALFAMAALFGGRGKNGRARDAGPEGAGDPRSGGRGWLGAANLREEKRLEEELGPHRPPLAKKESGVWRAP